MSFSGKFTVNIKINRIPFETFSLCHLSEPLPMKQRALPQSFWQEPNVTHLQAPAGGLGLAQEPPIRGLPPLNSYMIDSAEYGGHDPVGSSNGYLYDEVTSGLNGLSTSQSLTSLQTACDEKPLRFGLKYLSFD